MYNKAQKYLIIASDYQTKIEQVEIDSGIELLLVGIEKDKDLQKLFNGHPFTQFNNIADALQYIVLKNSGLIN